MGTKTAKLLVLCLWITLSTVCTACAAQPSPQDLKVIEGLRGELASVKQEITEAEKKDSTLAGGLVKALVETRLEILKTTEALIQQRVQAIEAGAKIEVTIQGSKPDSKLAQELEAEITKQKEQLEEARRDAARYSGGLVGAMKSATVATAEQTLAMLQQRYLAAKYGLPGVVPRLPSPAAEAETAAVSRGSDQSAAPSKSGVAEKIIGVRLLSKRFAEQEFQDYIFFDVEFTATGLDKPARAIKGVLHLQDLFGEPRMNIGWTIDMPLAPGQSVVEKGTGFKFNQFIESHQWARSTKLENMTASMTVTSVLYQDGTRLDL